MVFRHLNAETVGSSRRGDGHGFGFFGGTEHLLACARFVGTVFRKIGLRSRPFAWGRELIEFVFHILAVLFSLGLEGLDVAVELDISAALQDGNVFEPSAR